MPFAIVAEFPLGTYRASQGEGEIDLWPSPARLHSALLAAAGRGVRAVEHDGLLAPAPDDVDALAWLEGNPPDGLALPLANVHPATNTAYREMGLLRPGSSGTKKLPKRDSAAVSLAESIMWLWEAEPPRAVRERLDDLCSDVPYLGRSDSPVRLRTATSGLRGATHHRDKAARLSTSRRTDVTMVAPRPGRTKVLLDAHAAEASAQPPAARHDRVASDEVDIRPAFTTTATGRERYVPAQAVPSPTPWESVWLLPILDMSGTERIGIGDRVRWSVALHRALISVYGDDAPPFLTGHHDPGLALPANRLAIHVIDRHPAARTALPSEQGFAIAIPSGATPTDLAAVAAAFEAVKVVRTRGGTARLAAPGDRPPPVLGSEFWSPSDEGLLRCWTTSPTVADVRPPRRGAWSLADSVALSTGMVFRDTLLTAEDLQLGRDSRHQLLVERVRERGLDVLDVRRLAASSVERFAHKVPSGLVVDPYVATLRLGDLTPTEGNWLAIGQSRHLGGGLLVPVDVDAGTLEIWRQR